MQSLMATKFLHMLGSDDIQTRLFRPALCREKIGAICMTEPNAGSDHGCPHGKESAMAKLFASETAAEVCDQAARVLASYGLAMEHPVQRYLRDVRFTLIGGGTSEILKLIIAKEMAG